MKSIFITVFLASSAAHAESVDWTKYPVTRRVNAHFGIDLHSVDQSINLYWHASPPNHLYQRIVSGPTYSVAPTNTFVDPDFGNVVNFWDFTDRQSLALSFDWVMDVSNVLNNIDPTRIGAYDTTSDEYKLYTRDERLTHINALVQSVNAELTQSLHGDTNPYSIAKAAFQWTLDHMAYALVPTLHRDRGTDELARQPFQHGALTYYKGDCGEYSHLYNAILRSFGIPARMAAGGWSDNGGAHVWSEILLPGYGWVPVDTSVADVFIYDEGTELNALGDKALGQPTFANVTSPFFYLGSIDPFRFVMSYGSEIALTPAPDWDFSAQNLSWFYKDGRADILQIGVFNIFANEIDTTYFTDMNHEHADPSPRRSRSAR